MAKDEKNPFSDFTGAITALAEEKGLAVDDVMTTVETAIAAAYKKEYGKRGQNIRAELNSVSGEMKFYLMKEVVDETTREFIDPEAEEEVVEESEIQDIIVDEGEAEDRKQRFNPERDIMIADARERYGAVELSSVVEEQLPSYTEFGRVAAQTAKQVIIQRIREAERNAMYSEYKEKEGGVINGTVQRVEGKNIFIDLGKSVGVLFPREQVRGERYNAGQRLKVYVESVELDPKGPGIKLSRVHPEMIRRLFELEVPEIFAGSVEIKAIAREAGSRSKIAVHTEEEGIDPIGSCVGQKGTRVNAIIEELGGEKIDIIEWHENTEKFITAALSPATVLEVRLDEEKHKAVVVVPNEQLSLAIGKRGQNVRLAVKLTHWDLDVVSADESRVPGAERPLDKKDEEIIETTPEEELKKLQEMQEAAAAAIKSMSDSLQETSISEEPVKKVKKSAKKSKVADEIDSEEDVIEEKPKKKKKK